MKRLLGLALVAACSAPPTPTPAPIAMTRRAQSPRPLPPPAPTSCGDASVILRGPSGDDEDTARKREQAIELACVEDVWSRKVLDCIGDKPAKHDVCLEQLTAAQRTGYDDRVAVTLPVKPIGCVDGVGRVDAYEPRAGLAGDDRALVSELRRHAIEERCDADSWDPGVRQCFHAGKDPIICRAQLTKVQDDAVVAALSSIDALAARLATVQKKPGSISCKAIAAAHYKGTQKPIVELRTWMTRSCTDETWTASVRSCAIAGDLATCLKATGSKARWDTTPLATPTGLIECDEFARAVTASLRCATVRQVHTRDVFDEARERIANGDSARTGEACDDAKVDLHDTMADQHCKP